MNQFFCDDSTGRVCDMLNVFEDVNHAKYQKKTVTSNNSSSLLDNVDNDKKIKAAILNNKGTVHEGADYIRFENVPIVSPNNDILVESCSFEIKIGDHLLITGMLECNAAERMNC